MVEPRKKSVGGSLWLKIAVILIFVGGMGWLVRRAWQFRSPGGDTLIVKKKPLAARSGKSSTRPARQDLIIDRTSSSTVYAGPLVVQVTRPTGASARKTLDLRLSLRGAVVPGGAENHQAERAIRALTYDRDLAEELQITPEQRKTLIALNPTGRISFSTEEEKALREAFEVYYKSDVLAGHFLEEAIVGALRDLAPRKVAAARRAVAEGMEQYQALLTPEQRERLYAAATRPVTRPALKATATRATTRPARKAAATQTTRPASKAAIRATTRPAINRATQRPSTRAAAQP